MGHLSNYRRVLIWGMGTLLAMVGAIRLAIFFFFNTPATGDLVLFGFLFAGGMFAIVLNEAVFTARKTQLEIDRDEAIKGTGEKHLQSPLILAICPQCKKRIPSDSKYCLECGADLQLRTTTPSGP